MDAWRAPGTCARHLGWMLIKNHPFEPLLVFDSCEDRPISSVEEALALLLTKSNRDYGARIDASEACISTLKGVVPAVVAREAFIDFAELLHSHNPAQFPP
jgi:hypothetical protein